MDLDGRAFNSALSEGDVRRAGKILRAYSQNLDFLCRAVDVAPELSTYIFTIIPRLVQNFNDRFQAHLHEPQVYAMSELSATLGQVKPLYQELIQSFQMLNLMRCEQLVKAVLRLLKGLEQHVQFEQTASELFSAHAKEVTAEAALAVQRYEELFSQYQSLVNQGYVGAFELADEIEASKLTATLLKTKLATLSPESLVSVNPSGKLLRLRLVCKSAIQLLELINQVNQAF